MNGGRVMSSRDDILRLIRSGAPAPVSRPKVPFAGIEYPDPIARFAVAMGEVGGSCVRLAEPGGLEAELEKLPAYRDAKKVASCVPGIARANVDLRSITDPHLLRDVDFAVLPGELGVAESGAVWVLEEKIHPRAVAFLAQHIAVVLPATAIVHNLHQAYERLPAFTQGFAMWLSGPSKTADIEQALVIGAHGPRSCVAVLI
jgi:L-lactate dehydrogenase complex protein LldG